MSRKKEYGEKMEELLKAFLKMFRDWVEDFEDLAHRRKKSAAISTRFLERRAQALLNAFDELKNVLEETSEELAKEYREITTLGRKQETEKRLSNFKKEAIALIQRVNAKADVLLSDFIVSPFNSEIKKRLEEVSKYTYEDLIKNLKTEE